MTELPKIEGVGLKKLKKTFKIVGSTKNKSKELEVINPFKEKMQKILEIKIYLKNNFKLEEVDDVFIRDVENEYAEQYLIKMDILPTQQNINKILSMRPLEFCDFNITGENELSDVGGCHRIIHIYPNGAETNRKLNQKVYVSAEMNFIKSLKKKKNMNINSSGNFLKKKEFQNIQSFKKNEKNSNEDKNNLIYKKEEVDKLITSAKDDIIDKQFFAESCGTMDIDLSSENIRKNYIFFAKNSEDLENKILGKGKFSNISKSLSMKKNILTDDKYKFNIYEVQGLTKEIIDELNEPFNLHVEVILKDLNYIIDNFPFDDFISIEDDVDKKKEREIQKDKIAKNEEILYKIKIDNKLQLKTICEQLHSMSTARIIGLTLNLLYWVVFSGVSTIQIDSSTKQFLYLKILKEFDAIENNFPIKKIYYPIFVPLFIIVTRIECDNCLRRKFKKLFRIEESKAQSLDLVNKVITEIYDRHSFHNSFGTICGKSNDFKQKILKGMLPRFKGKLYATSNMLEQIFNNDNSDINYKTADLSSNGELAHRKEFINGKKIDFFSGFLEKINKNLKRRNLEPIFKIRSKNAFNNSKDINNNKSYNNNINNNNNNNNSKNIIRTKSLKTDVNIDTTTKIKDKSSGDDSDVKGIKLSTIQNDSKSLRDRKMKNVLYYIEHSKLKDLNYFNYNTEFN